MREDGGYGEGYVGLGAVHAPVDVVGTRARGQDGGAAGATIEGADEYYLVQLLGASSKDTSV